MTFYRATRFVAALAACAALSAVDAARADGAAPVVVELFTSQGCSSCPPADAILGELAGRDDVLALTLNVDYWDYLGWKDDLALPGHAVRQRTYRAALGGRSVYTPQAIVHGATAVIGSRRGELEAAIDAHQSEELPAAVSIRREGDQLLVTVSPTSGAVEIQTTVMLVPYDGPFEHAIGRGENAGRSITYFNVVRAWTPLGAWDGAETAVFTAAVDPDMQGYAVLVQPQDLNRMVGVGHYRLAAPGSN